MAHSIFETFSCMCVLERIRMNGGNCRKIQYKQESSFFPRVVFLYESALRKSCNLSIVTICLQVTCPFFLKMLLFLSEHLDSRCTVIKIAQNLVLQNSPFFNRAF